MTAPGNNPDKITYFAETDYRSRRIKFGIRDDDRARHMYVIGKTGMGKSTLLENLVIQDIQNGEGVCFIDPHGGTAETLLSYVPEHRIKDVIYFAPFDQEFPVGLNVLEDMGRDKRPLVVSGLMGSFKKVWVDMWSARMEYILNNTMLALMETPGTTLLGVNRMYSDKDYRNMIVANVTDPSVRAFWVDEYAKYSEKFATEATAAIQNKVGQFAANPLIRNMVGQPKSTFDIRRVMDERKIFIVNLSKGRMGEGNANLVGSMLITKIYLAAMSRADVGAKEVSSLPPFYLYVDEFQSFANESFADILSEARKYKLALTIAHQYIEQMSDEVRAAVFGNVGTMISFRVGSYDADVLEKEFAPVFLAEDMVNLGFAQVYMKLMIRGIGSPPFSATTLNRPKLPAHNYAAEVLQSSHAQFARPRSEVESEISKWHEPVQPASRDVESSSAPETKKYAPGTRPYRPTPAPFVPSAVLRESAGSPAAVPQKNDTFLSDEPMPIAMDPVAPAKTIISMPLPQKPKIPIIPQLAPVLQVVVATPSPLSIPQKPSIPVVPPQVMINNQELREVESTQTSSVQEKNLNRSASEFIPTKPNPTSLPPASPPPAYQPFKAEFSKLDSTKSVAVELGVPNRANIQISAQPEQKKEGNFASLSNLKSQPKKNKGPSDGNLSSLRAVLEAVSASRAKEVVVPVVTQKVDNIPAGSSVDGVEKPDPITKEKVEIPRETKGEPQLVHPQSFFSEQNDDQHHTKEIPKNVLMGVLAD